MAVVRWLVASDPGLRLTQTKCPNDFAASQASEVFLLFGLLIQISLGPQQTNELLTLITTDAEASILEISSMANAYEIVSIPPPW